MLVSMIAMTIAHEQALYFNPSREKAHVSSQPARSGRLSLTRLFPLARDFSRYPQMDSLLVSYYRGVLDDN